MSDVCDLVIEQATKLGANEVAATLQRSSGVDVQVRAKQVEKLENYDTGMLTVAIYVDGRYAAHSTNDLRPAALETFLKHAVAMTRLLEPDPFRRLPEPKLFSGRRTEDLGLVDRSFYQFGAPINKSLALAVEGAATSLKDAPIVSATANASSSLTTVTRVTSNGFRDTESRSTFTTGSAVTMKDGDKRPEDWAYYSAQRSGTLPAPKAIGEEAAERAKNRLGAKSLPSGAWSLVIENRAAGTLFRHFMAALNGSALQQKRSFLDGKIGQKVMSEKLTLIDDPWLEGGLGSRRFDQEGLATERREIVAAGVLKNYYIDHYYGAKLALPPTSGGMSNLVVAPGKESLAALIAKMGKGLVVTSFIGGNSNSLTGDFSLGLSGYAVEGGKRTHAVSEMNLSGNHKDFWNKLAAVGSDGWRWSPLVTPSLWFEGVAVSGA